MQNSTVRPSPPFPALHRALLALAATREGFEALGAAVIDELSGGMIRLMPSGDQQGVDGVSSEAASGPRRAMQAKRYRDRTALKLGELLSEMDRASEAFTELETWVLVTTRTLFAKEKEALARHAETLGWTFISLDWGVASGVPLLAAACAATPAVDALLFDSAARRELAALRAGDLWRNPAADLVARLSAPRAGFIPAQHAAAVALQTLYDDPIAARHRAGPSPALLTEAPPVVRTQVQTDIGDWWSADEPILALLGGEGVGKTWAALEGLRLLAGRPEGPLPLIISSETARHSPDALAAVVAALVELGEEAGVRVREPARYWRRKLLLWRTGGGAAILVLVDGLDEAMEVRWPKFLASLLEARWNGLFRLVVTCREDEWAGDVGLGNGELGGARAVTIPNFSVDERDAFLTGRGVVLADVSDDVLAACLHPRTAFHLTRLARGCCQSNRNSSPPGAVRAGEGGP